MQLDIKFSLKSRCIIIIIIIFISRFFSQAEVGGFPVE